MPSRTIHSNTPSLVAEGRLSNLMLTSICKPPLGDYLSLLRRRGKPLQDKSPESWSECFHGEFRKAKAACPPNAQGWAPLGRYVWTKPKKKRSRIEVCNNLSMQYNKTISNVHPNYRKHPRMPYLRFEEKARFQINSVAGAKCSSSKASYLSFV